MWGGAPAAVLNTLKYDPQLCINCGMCLAVCPHGVFGPGQSVVLLANPDACMECGACQRNCPTNAISVESGVGCASAMIRAALTGSKVVTCGDDGGCGSSEAGRTPGGGETETAHGSCCDSTRVTAQPTESCCGSGAAADLCGEGEVKAASCCGGDSSSCCCG